MNQVIRILHVVACLHDGGVERMLYNYYLQFDRSKIHFDFIVHGKEKGILEKEFASLGCKIYHVTLKRDNIVKHIIEIFKIMNNVQYDMIHSHVDEKSFIYLSIAKLCNIEKRIAHAHTIKNSNNYIAKTSKFLLRKFAKYYFACSIEAAYDLYSGKIVKSNHFFLITNAIDILNFGYDISVRESLRAQFKVKNDLVIGNIGRLTYQKNQEFLLDIFYAIAKVKDDVKLILIGSGDQEKSLKEKAITLGIQEKILFLGARKSVHDYYQIMDIFVFPSNYEGLGIALIEAQVAGLPCFASNQVPKSAKVTDLVEFMSLDLSAEEWAQAILNNTYNERVGRIEEVREANYDIKVEYKKLENLYSLIYHQ